jgi:hypothetical protein
LRHGLSGTLGKPSREGVDFNPPKAKNLPICIFLLIFQTRMRYLTFFPYIGGKRYMLRHILRMIPGHRVYVEVFGGSGEVLLNEGRSEVEV